MEPGRCSIHGLILAADGKCVICRRGQATEDEPTKTISDPMWAVIIGGVIIIGAGAWLVFADPFTTKPKRANEPVVLKNNTSPPATGAVVELPPPRHTTVFVSLDPPKSSASAVATEPEPVDSGDAALQAAMKQVRIVMYSKGSDPFCAQVRTFLTKRKYSFTDFDVEKSETDMIQMRALDASGTVPVLDVEGNVLVGFDRQEFESTVRRVAEAKLKPKR
ncbi:MAG: glutaredoxin family protein [Polyangiaceae bacterium]